MEIDLIWHTLEETASAMENGEGDWHALVATAQLSIKTLFEYPPPDIVEKAAQSRYPAKPIIQWILHEGQKIPGIGVDKLVGLCDCWNQSMGKESGAITFPPMSHMH